MRVWLALLWLALVPMLAGTALAATTPVARWKLDESTGLTAADSVGGHAGALKGGAALTGGHLSLDGKSGYVEIPSHEDFDLAGEFSIALWVRPAKLITSTQGSGREKTSRTLLGRGDGHDFIQFAFETWDNRLRDPRGPDGGYLQAGKWSHVAMTVRKSPDGSGWYERRIYQDGVLVGLALTEWQTKLYDFPLWIGRGVTFKSTKNPGKDSNLDDNESMYFEGDLKDIRLYEGALSTEEVVALAGTVGCLPPLLACGDQCVDIDSDAAHCGGCGNGCGGSEVCWAGSCVAKGASCSDDVAGGLVGYWPFDEGSGTTMADLSGGGHHGKLKGGAAFGAGKIGQALVLDGTDDYAEVPAHQDFQKDGFQEFSLSAWIKSDAYPKIKTDNGNEKSARTIFGVGDGHDDIQFGLLIAGHHVSSLPTANGGYLTPGSWHHIAFVQQPTRDGRSWHLRSTYLDGELVARTVHPEGIDPENLPIWFGRGVTFKSTIDPGKDLDLSDNVSTFFDGAIDEARIYGRGLSSAEIARLANCTAAGEVSCDSDQDQCGTRCVDLSTAATDCGACDQPCPGGAECVSGDCQCSGSSTECAGTCRDTMTDPAHCGECSQACASNESCKAGTCACPEGLARCGNECVDLQSSASNCGECENACDDALVCNRGSCSDSCDPSLTQCGRDCVNVESSLSHCGACDSGCELEGATASCMDGACVVATCHPLRVDVDGLAENGCECVETVAGSCEPAGAECPGDECPGGESGDEGGCGCRVGPIAGGGLQWGLLLIGLAGVWIRRRTALP